MPNFGHFVKEMCHCVTYPLGKVLKANRSFIVLSVYCHAHTTRINEDFVLQIDCGSKRKCGKFELNCIINSDLFMGMNKKDEIHSACEMSNEFIKCAADVIRRYKCEEVHTYTMICTILWKNTIFIICFYFSCKLFKYCFALIV